MRKGLYFLALLPVALLGCGASKDVSAAAKVPVGNHGIQSGIVHMRPGPGNATADQRVGSKLGT